MLRLLLNGIILAGCVLMLWPLGQTAYGRWSQSTLHAEWENEAAQARSTPVPATSPLPAPSKAQSPKPEIAAWPSTRLVIPEISLDTVVLQGWEESVLRRAPGHAPSTSPPGGANCVIAAHRNVYGSWFNRLDQLLPGSVIQLVTPRATYTYRMALAFSVADTDTTILKPMAGADGRPQLTLVTCTLPRTSTRLVTVALLEDPQR